MSECYVATYPTKVVQAVVGKITSKDSKSFKTNTRVQGVLQSEQGTSVVDCGPSKSTSIPEPSSSIGSATEASPALGQDTTAASETSEVSFPSKCGNNGS